MFLQGSLNCYFKLFVMPHETCRPADSQSSSAALTCYFQCSFYFYSQIGLNSFCLCPLSSPISCPVRENMVPCLIFSLMTQVYTRNSIHTSYILSLSFGVMKCSYVTKLLIGFISFYREGAFASVSFDAWRYSSGASCVGWTWCAAGPQAGHGTIHPHQPQHCKYEYTVK